MAQPRACDTPSVIIKNDLLTGLSNVHLSWMLYTMMPAKYVLQSPAQEHDKGKFEYLSELIAKFNKSTGSEFLFTGSSYQGVSVPRYTPMSTFATKGREPEIWYTDYDVMVMNYPRFLVGHKHDVGGDRPKFPICAVAENNETYPGYLKLRIVKEGMIGSKYLTSRGAEKYVSSHLLLENKLTMTKTPAADSKGRFKCAITGPSLEISDKVNSLDMVTAFKCVSWPEQAKDWAIRHRASNWLPRDTAVALMVDGCHVVAKSHDRSSDSEVEWRYSLSVAENKLVSLWNDTQRQCYVLLKVLALEALSPPKILSSYHLKTVLFWACDDIPSHIWIPRNISICLLIVLDRLLHCLISHNIPNYFMPGSNLIAHVDADFIFHLTTKVSKVRRNPLRYLFDFNKKFRVWYSPFTLTWEEMFQPVLLNSGLAPTTFSSFNKATGDALLMGIVQLLAEENFNAALGYAEQQVGEPGGLQFLCNVLSCNHLSLESSIKAMEYIHEKIPDDKSMLSNLACYYHCRIHEVDDALVKQQLVEKTDITFQKVHANGGGDAGTMADYANYLRDTDRCEDAIPVCAISQQLFQPERGKHCR